MAIEAGVFTPTMKAGELVAWLKQEFDLGHGHPWRCGPRSRTTAGCMRPAGSKVGLRRDCLPESTSEVDHRAQPSPASLRPPVAGEERAGPAPLVVFTQNMNRARSESNRRAELDAAGAQGRAGQPAEDVRWSTRRSRNRSSRWC